MVFQIARCEWIAEDWVMDISKGLERKDNLIKLVISDIPFYSVAFGGDRILHNMTFWRKVKKKPRLLSARYKIKWR